MKITSQVTIERDRQGVPTIHADTRQDMAFALGFLHSQERYFQMDLLRRVSSGRLSELLGEAALSVDEKFRKHRFQFVAATVLERLPESHRELVDAYTEGVNRGLSELKAPTFEYTLLRTTAARWQPVDCIYVMLTMLADLQPIDADRDIALGLLRDRVPQEVFDFLVRKGSTWDAALDDTMFPEPQVPLESVWSLRADATPSDRPEIPPEAQVSLPFFHQLDPECRAASNSWAISATLSKDNRPLLATDMHLGLRVPTIWYRAVMNTPCFDGTRRRLVGVTLPGAPALVEGSNGSIAWGLTNSYGDYGDVVELSPVEGKEDHYRSPAGTKRIQRFSESIAFPGGSKSIEYEWTEWGPVVAIQNGRRFVHRWVGSDPQASDLRLFDLESATTAEDALSRFNHCGMPHLNVVVVDRENNLGWTLCGRIPLRTGVATCYPIDASQGGMWTDYLDPTKVPRIFNPPDGRIWTANNRIVGGDMLAAVGDGGYDLGARARQIRDRLRSQSSFDEQAMLAIQLDDEALFLARWQKLMVSTLDIDNQSVSSDFAQHVRSWGSRASTDSVGYRMVRTFRNQVIQRFFGVPLHAKDSESIKGAIPKQIGLHRPLPVSHEDVVWQLISERPQHWLPRDYGTWDDLLVDAAKSTEKELTRGRRLQDATWGESNKAEIHHPLSMGLPLIRDWLGMPNVPLPGDNHMPRVQRSGFGASQRMVVSPGFEEEGIYHQPGGQSGHPYSPFYKAGYDDWASGKPSPLLPGPTLHTLILKP
jgi:penicillin amidase